MVLLNKVFADRAFLAATKQHPVRQHDGHYAVWLQVKQVVEQKGKVGLGLGCQPKGRKTGVRILVGGLPRLRVRGVGYHRIHIQRIVRACGVAVVKVRPVVFKGIAISGDDVVWQNAAHHKVHAREVVGVFFQFLRVVFDVVFAGDVLGH